MVNMIKALDHYLRRKVGKGYQGAHADIHRRCRSTYVGSVPGVVHAAGVPASDDGDDDESDGPATATSADGA